MSFLSTQVPVQLSILGVIIGFIILIAVMATLSYFIMYWNDIRTKNPELHVLRKARKHPYPPIIALVDGAGKIILSIGEKEKKSDVQFKKDDYGLLIDPAILTKQPKSSLADGTTVYFYGTDTYFPTDPLSMRTIRQLIHHMRKEFQVFEYINNDIVLMELLFKEGSDLLFDCGTVISRMELDAVIEVEQDGEVIKRQLVEPEELAYAIEQSKSQLKTVKVSNGFFSFNEGLSRLPLATVAGDFKRAIQLVQQASELKKDDDMMFKAAVAFAVVVGAIVVATIALK